MSERFALFADEMFSAVEGYLARTLRPLLARLDSIESRPGPAGKDGRDASPEDIDKAVDRAVAALPKPKDGIDGAPGTRGDTGRDGKDGNDGRDAAAIEPLPAIDVTRSYPRGTWAKHAGGLWLARSVTDGMAGWDCVVVGLAAVDVETDGRSFTVKSMLSDGQTRSAEFELRHMNYRGAWAPGEYAPGDTVSWDGSMWHCDRATNERPSNERPKDMDNPAPWRLCVKHGRDGKDGVRGPKGERGADGKPGRDLTQLGFDGRRT